MKTFSSKKLLPLLLVGLLILTLPCVFFAVLRHDKNVRDAAVPDYPQHKFSQVDGATYGGISRNWIIADGLHLDHTERITVYGGVPLAVRNKAFELTPNTPFLLTASTSPECPSIKGVTVLSIKTEAVETPYTIALNVPGTVESVYGEQAVDSVRQPFRWQINTLTWGAAQGITLSDILLTSLSAERIMIYAITEHYDCMPESMQGYTSVSPKVDPLADATYLSGLLQSAGVSDGAVGLWRTVMGVPFQLTSTYNLGFSGVSLPENHDVSILVTWSTGRSQPILQDYFGELHYLGSYAGKELGIMQFRTEPENLRTYVLVDVDSILGITIRPVDYLLAQQ